MVLHDAIKTIQNGVCFFLRTKTCFFYKNLKSRIKKTRGLFFFRVFLNLEYLSILFCDFRLIARSVKSHDAISLIGCAPKISGNEKAENHWLLNT